MITVTAAEPGRDGATTYTLADGGVVIGHAYVHPVGPPQFGQSNREYWREGPGAMITNVDIAAWDAAIAEHSQTGEGGGTGAGNGS